MFRRDYVELMARKKWIAAALVLLGGFTFQAAYAAPAATIRVLRAVACCSESCRHAGTFDHAARCCQVRQDMRDLATAAKGKTRSAAPSSAISAPIPRDAAPPVMRHLGVVKREVFARPAPIFLLDRSLLL
jgi:hypothetical protein